jgi:predicted NUDIX family NTP pyrophosphohydrolase
MPVRPSAGILLFRLTADDIEVLLGHPGGPYWARKDDGAWGIPKGEFEDHEGDDAYAVARREFREETGHDAPDVPEADAIPLGTIRKRSGKVVTAWALEGDLDPATAVSNTFPMEWPPRSGTMIDVPEFDRLAWFTATAAADKMRGAETPLLDRLVEALATSPRTAARRTT